MSRKVIPVFRFYISILHLSPLPLNPRVREGAIPQLLPTACIDGSLCERSLMHCIRLVIISARLSLIIDVN